MPLALDPDQTEPVWLESDAHKPLAERPVFLFRYLTTRQLRKVQELRARAADPNLKNAEADSLIIEGLMVALSGWRNMNDIPYEKDVTAVTSMDERWELINTYPGVVVSGEIDKKKPASSSPSPEATGKSAGDAKATASTSAEPAPTSPA